MSVRTRVLAFGLAGMLVVAGGLSAALIDGLIGQLLTVVLISVGLGGAVLLLFLEVGLSEERERSADRERSAEQRGQDRRPVRPGSPRSRSGPAARRWPRRPS